MREIGTVPSPASGPAPEPAQRAVAAAHPHARRIDLVFPRFKLMSGAERAILGLAEGLARAGHLPRIVCHQFDDSCRPRLAPGVELAASGDRLDFSRNRYLNAVFDYGRTLRLAALLDEAADLRVFFGPALLLAWRNLRRAQHARIPSIYYCWEPPRVLYQDRAEVLRRIGWLRLPMAVALAAYRRLDRRMVRSVDAVVTSSPFAAERIEACYGRPAEVITLGIDRDRLDAGLPAEGAASKDGPPRLLTVNYLHPRKRIGLIVEAFAELVGRCQRDGRDVPVLTIVGDGPERPVLAALAARLGVAGRVELAGFVPDAELPRYYGAAACYVHATREESFGLSVIEAAYCGCPVVAVDEGGVRDTVENGVTGYRVAATPAAIADGIARVLGAPDGGTALGAAGRAKVAGEFRWSRGAEDLLGAARRVEDAW
jgi:glycosyltransferase involved in cell wall biosynthesis